MYCAKYVDFGARAAVVRFFGLFHISLWLLFPIPRNVYPTELWLHFLRVFVEGMWKEKSWMRKVTSHFPFPNNVQVQSFHFRESPFLLPSASHCFPKVRLIFSLSHLLHGRVHYGEQMTRYASEHYRRHRQYILLLLISFTNKYCVESRRRKILQLDSSWK